MTDYLPTSTNYLVFTSKPKHRSRNSITLNLIQQSPIYNDLINNLPETSETASNLVNTFLNKESYDVVNLYSNSTEVSDFFTKFKDNPQNAIEQIKLLVATKERNLAKSLPSICAIEFLQKGKIHSKKDTSYLLEIINNSLITQLEISEILFQNFIASMRKSKSPTDLANIFTNDSILNTIETALKTGDSTGQYTHPAWNAPLARCLEFLTHALYWLSPLAEEKKPKINKKINRINNILNCVGLLTSKIKHFNLLAETIHELNLYFEQLNRHNYDEKPIPQSTEFITTFLKTNPNLLVTLPEYKESLFIYSDPQCQGTKIIYLR